jgi:DNA repair exonuclease SbcCD ATPase subunit
MYRRLTQEGTPRVPPASLSTESPPSVADGQGTIETLEAEARERERDAALDAHLEKLSQFSREVSELHKRDSRRWAEDADELRDQLGEACREVAAGQAVIERLENDARQGEEARSELQRELELVRRDLADAAAEAEEQRRAYAQTEERLARLQAELENREAVHAEAARQLDAAVQRRMESFLEAEREADAARARDEAEAEARSVQLAELEGRIVEARDVLAELRTESSREHERRAALDDRLRAVIGSDSPAACEPDDDLRGETEHPETEQPDTGNGWPAPVESSDASQEHRQHGLFRRREKGPFIGRPGYCSICSRELLVESRQGLAESGWIVRGDEAVCVSCQEEGWELPEGAPLPLRRSSRPV